MSYRLDELLKSADAFVPRHLSLTQADREAMLATCGLDSLESLIDQTVPDAIRLSTELDLAEPQGERVVVERMRRYADKNRVLISMIGQGYSSVTLSTVRCG